MLHDPVPWYVAGVIILYVVSMLLFALSALRAHITLLKWDAVGSWAYIPLVVLSVIVVAIAAGWLVLPAVWLSNRGRRRGR